MASWRTRVSLATLGHRLQAVPMLLMLVPFTLGIILHESYLIPLGLAIVAMLLTALATWLLLPRWSAWCYAAATLLLLGYGVAELRAPHSSTPYDTTIDMVVQIESTPRMRTGYSVADGRIISWQGDGDRHHADDKVLLWLRSDSIAYSLAPHTPHIAPRELRPTDASSWLCRRHQHRRPQHPIL